MMPWIGGLWGINDVAKISLDQAAGVIIGAAEAYEKAPLSGKKVVGITSLGMAAARYLYHLRPALQEKGYETAAFHATGMNTRVFEKAIADGMFDFVLDLYAGQELINGICGSLFSPGIRRLEAAAKSGVPQIVSLGIIEMCLWGADRPVPEKFADGMVFPHTPLLTVFFTTLDEKVEMAKQLVEKLNQAIGPTAVIVPLKDPFGLTKWGLEDPEGQKAVRNELQRGLKSKINYVEVDASTDDKAFADRVVSLMEQMGK